jgi:hypothetical protein
MIGIRLPPTHQTVAIYPPETAWRPMRRAKQMVARPHTRRRYDRPSFLLFSLPRGGTSRILEGLVVAGAWLSGGRGLVVPLPPTVLAIRLAGSAGS